MFSKLTWLRDLRGRGLSPVQFTVLVAMFSYTDKKGGGAHPGWARLQQDTLLDLRTIKRAVRDLVELGYLIQTAEGGNQYGKGRANEYALGDLTKIREGGHLMHPLTKSLARALTPGNRRPSDRELAVEKDRQLAALQAAIGAEGVHPVQPRGTSGALEGVHGMTPHQITTSDPSIIPPPAASGPDTAIDDLWKTLRGDFAALEGWLLKSLGALTAEESSTALGMWEKNEHPKAIANTIKAGRAERWAS